MHSTSRVAYDISAGYARFEASATIDDSAGKGGSVVFRIFLDDGQGEWKAALESPVVRGGDKPVAISVDLSGAQRLALIVDAADRGDTLDRADWLPPR